MPCFCGHRVERAHSSVQCERCKEMYHLQCVVGTLAADLNYFKNCEEVYICGVCAVAHREVGMSSLNAVAIQQQQPVNNIEQDPLSAILAELKSLRAEQATAVAGIHSLQADKNRLLGELEFVRSELMNLHKLYDEGVAGALTSLTSEVNELRCSAGKIKGKNGGAKNKQTAGKHNNKQNNNSKHSIDEHGNNNANGAAVTADNDSNDSAGKNVVSTNNNNESVANMMTTPIYSIANSAASTISLPSGGSVPAFAPSNTTSYASRVAFPVTDAVTSGAAVTFAPTGLHSQTNTVRDNHGTNGNDLRGIRGVYGRNVNNELEVVVKKKWLHVSSFKPTVSETSVIDYVSKYAGVDRSHLSCRKLVKSGVPLDSLESVNFKLGVTTALYEKVLDPNVWPADINVRPFRFFQGKFSDM